jgi:hypothetical protein
MKNTLVTLFTVCSFATVSAHDWSTARPDGHAPIGVMGDHTHGKREWMASYRYMNMAMEGNRSGTSNISTAGVLAGWPVAPLEMTMHMLGVMYAPIEKLTLTAMLPFSFISMDHITRTGVRFTTETHGVGDLQLGGLYELGRWDQHGVHLNFGFGLPTGSVDERDATPAGANSLLPYPMQLGSGTVDFLPGLTHLGQSEDWSWGSQLRGTVRLGDNEEDYSLGDRLGASGWLARKICSMASVSGRLSSDTWGNIDGAESRVNPMMVPTADTGRRGGTRLDMLFGLNLYRSSGFLKGHRLAIEGGIPVYQRLDGPQLETDWLLTAGWQYA